MEHPDRAERRQLLHAAVEAFLDHFEEDYDGDEEVHEPYISMYGIIAAVDYKDDDGDEHNVPAFWLSDPRRIVQYGLLHLAAESAVD